MTTGTRGPTWSFVPCNRNNEENDAHVVLWGVNAINGLSDDVGLQKTQNKTSYTVSPVCQLHRDIAAKPSQQRNRTLPWWVCRLWSPITWQCRLLSKNTPAATTQIGVHTSQKQEKVRLVTHLNTYKHLHCIAMDITRSQLRNTGMLDLKSRSSPIAHALMNYWLRKWPATLSAREEGSQN